MNNELKRFGKVREKISNKFGTIKVFAEAMEINCATLSKKLNGRNEFSRIEIAKMCELLEIPTEEITDYFFYR